PVNGTVFEHVRLAQIEGLDPGEFRLRAARVSEQEDGDLSRVLTALELDPVAVAIDRAGEDSHAGVFARREMISEPDRVALLGRFELFDRSINLVVEAGAVNVDEIGFSVIALILSERHGERQ